MAISKTNIEKSLIEQLVKKGADVDVFRDVIEDYLFLCSQIKKMKSDVRKNGFTVKAISAQGKEYEKENPCVKNAVIYNRQKLAILNQLGLTTENIESPEDEESDL